MRELLRRLILLICICSAIWLAKYADLSPLIFVETVDSEELQKNGEAVFFRVEGAEWDDLANKLNALDEKRLTKELSMRLPSDLYPMNVLFFRTDELPVNKVTPYLKQNKEMFISLTHQGKTGYLKLRYKAYSDDDFQFGSGFSNYPPPPTYMLFPYRKYSLLIILLGLMIYIFIPRDKRYPQAIRYPAWRVSLGDVLALLFIVPFFSLPFFIVGGSAQAFTKGWPFLVVFWSFFLAGVWLLKVSAWFAGFSLLMRPEGLFISTYTGEREFSYKDMDFFQPVIFKPPKWLILFSRLAALSAKGSARIGATGRAMILSSAEYGSIGIKLKNGSDLYINITDQMGNTALNGFEQLLKTLKGAGVQEKDEVLEIRGLGLETLKLPKK